VRGDSDDMMFQRLDVVIELTVADDEDRIRVGDREGLPSDSELTKIIVKNDELTPSHHYS